jgi:hypothetical protein
LPVPALYLGTLVPDLIDKPLYYSASLLTGLHGREMGLLSGTRTFGHTLILCGLVALAARRRHSAALKAIALGMATHLFLDIVVDAGHASALQRPPGVDPILGIVAVFWPLLGWQFPVMGLAKAHLYLQASITPVTVPCEIIGALLLVADYVAWRRAKKAAQPAAAR